MDGNAKVFAAQEALQQIKQLLAENQPFSGTIDSLEKILGLTEVIKHISVIRLQNEHHLAEAFHYPDNTPSTQQAFLTRKSHLVAKKLKLQPVIYPHELSQLLAESGYSGTVTAVLIYPLQFEGHLYGFVAIEPVKELQQWQQADFNKLNIMASIFGAYFAKKNAFEQTALQQKVYTSIINGMNNLIYITDIHTNKILFMNQTMKDSFALEAPEGKICWKLLQQNMSQRCTFCPISKLLRDPTPNKVIHWEEVNSKTGRVYDNFDSLITWFDGSLVHLQQSVDITDSKKFFHDACFDELTNTLTRRAGKELLANLIADSQSNNSSFITCMFDINSLKPVNDTYGHSEGDKLIIRICKTVKSYLGSSDIFFRLSGDEFIIIFTEHPLQNVKEVLQKILLELKNTASKEGLPYEPSFTYSLFEYKPTSEYTMKDILNHVDEKMYEQKRAYHIHMRQQEAALQQRAGRLFLIRRNIFMTHWLTVPTITCMSVMSKVIFFTTQKPWSKNLTCRASTSKMPPRFGALKSIQKTKVLSWPLTRRFWTDAVTATMLNTGRRTKLANGSGYAAGDVCSITTWANQNSLPVL